MSQKKTRLPLANLLTGVYGIGKNRNGGFGKTEKAFRKSDLGGEERKLEGDNSKRKPRPLATGRKMEGTSPQSSPPFLAQGRGRSAIRRFYLLRKRRGREDWGESMLLLRKEAPIGGTGEEACANAEAQLSAKSP